MGCLTALNQFLSRLGELWLPLHKLLKKSDSFHRKEEAHKSRNDLKALITKPSVLASPEPGETLLLYVVATT
jgi:hypothetical protein